jgi:hypothetical protein
MNTLHCLILDSMKLGYACSIACQALEDAVSASFFTGMTCCNLDEVQRFSSKAGDVFVLGTDTCHML